MRHGKTAEAIRAIRREIQTTRAEVEIVGPALFLARVREALDPHEIERVHFRPTDDERRPLDPLGLFQAPDREWTGFPVPPALAPLFPFKAIKVYTGR